MTSINQYIKKLVLFLATVALVKATWIGISLGTGALKLPKSIYTPIDKITQHSDTFYRRTLVTPYIDSSKLLIQRTDRFGLYNPKEYKKPKIVTIGDSYTKGGFVSSKEMFSQVIERLTAKPTMNLGITANSNFKFLNYLVHSGEIAQPEVVVMEIVERNLMSWGSITADQQFNPFKTNMGYWLQAHDIIKKTRKVKNVDPNAEPKRYFYLNELTSISNESLLKVSDNLKSIQRSLKEKGIDVIWVIIPDPENAFRNELNLSGNNTILDFAKIAKNDQLNFVNIYDDMTNEKEKTYLFDDSHWSPYGIEIVAKKVVKIIMNNRKPQ